MKARRLAKEGTPMSKESKVVAITVPAPQEAPPLVDLATTILRFPVVGQKVKTSPALLVLMSQPIAVPVDSAPVTWIMVPQPAAVRRLTKPGLPLCQQE